MDTCRLSKAVAGVYSPATLRTLACAAVLLAACTPAAPAPDPNASLAAESDAPAFTASCRRSETSCDNRCFNLQTHLRNCGACGNACRSGELCQAGKCVAPGSTNVTTFCEKDTINCDGNTKKICDGAGGFSASEDCGSNTCVPGKGCVLCFPGTGRCNGSTSEVCNEDGMGRTPMFCDPDQQLTCLPSTGLCDGACATARIGSSYVGCEYYPTVTANVVPAQFHFAVAVANTKSDPANVKITRGAATVATVTVPPNEMSIVQLPWVSELKDASASALLQGGAYHLRSDQPITVYQYNPIEYTLNGTFSQTNDASLLLPVNAWTGDYRVASRNHYGSPGFYAITASRDDTHVTVTPSKTAKLVAAGGGIKADGTGTITMKAGDVLQVMTSSGGGSPDASDLTGTLIASDKPVQVIGGHKCTNVPWDAFACDHLEESIPPLQKLSSQYLVTAPLIPTGGAVPKVQMVRIVATADNTTLTYEPPQAGAPTTIAFAGDYVEIAKSATDFRVTASAKVIVAQYMTGQSLGGNSGDPAMMIAVATQQYRGSYLFHAPTNYEKNFVNVTAPDGAAVTLDGKPVTGLTPIGTTGFSVARVELSNAGTGNHTISSPKKFGVTVYGYGQYTSYWYPGGLDLADVF
ncbi:MAG: hypothetical protein IT381_00855 [Deltaproteobacteria bacterium]|nr:hypothetical protein [Deltaproteobacteria bacterium]